MLLCSFRRYRRLYMGDFTRVVIMTYLYNIFYETSLTNTSRFRVVVLQSREHARFNFPRGLDVAWFSDTNEISVFGWRGIFSGRTRNK